MPSGKYIRTAKARINIGLAAKGRTPWNKGKRSVYSAETIEKIRRAMLLRNADPSFRTRARATSLRNWALVKSGELSIRRSRLDGVNNPSWFSAGSDHWAWRGGCTPVNIKIRVSPKYAQWRNKVFRRDHYICQDCGTGNNLVAHHIKSFSEHVSLRFDVNNGITLCKQCHKKTDNYGRKSNNQKQHCSCP